MRLVINTFFFVEFEPGSVRCQKQKYLFATNKFRHAKGMASSFLRKMLFLTISNTIGVLVLVCPVIYHTCNGRWYDHWSMLGDVTPILIMYGRCYVKMCQML